MPRQRTVRLSNQGPVQAGEWIPAHAVRFHQNGTVDVMTEGKTPNRARNVADGYVDSSGRFHPIRWAMDYDPDRANEDDEANIHPSAAYYRKHGLKVPKSAATRKKKKATRKRR